MCPLAASMLVAAASSCDCSAEPLAETKPIMKLPEELDFGPIGQGTSIAKTVDVENVGDGELDITAAIGDGSSADFSLDNDVFKIAARDHGPIPVRFAPSDLGEDTGTLVVSGNDGDGAVRLHGGPIEPRLQAPVEVDFGDPPADASVVAKTVVLTNVGLATLHIDSTAPDAAANPQFAAPTAPFDVDLLPQESATFAVQYSRSARTDNGRLLVRTNDPGDAAGGGVRAVELIPDFLRQCEDGDDNDGDDIPDFPADPGCSDPHDDTEQNAAECVEGAVQVCGCGPCRGQRLCSAAGVFGDCDGDETASTDETCNGVDDDCDCTTDNNVPPAVCDVSGCAGTEACVEGGSGSTGPCIADDPNCAAPLCGNNVVDGGEQCDHGANNGLDGQCDANCQNVGGGTCDADGTWVLTTPEIVYACCFFVDIDITQFSVAGNGASATPTPSGDGMGAVPPADCTPNNTADFTLSKPGGCTETYSLTGTFTDANTFSGTYSATFVGSDCDCLGGQLGTPCTDQSFAVTMTR